MRRLFQNLIRFNARPGPQHRDVGEMSPPLHPLSDVFNEVATQHVRQTSNNAAVTIARGSYLSPQSLELPAEMAPDAVVQIQRRHYVGRRPGTGLFDMDPVIPEGESRL